MTLPKEPCFEWPDVCGGRLQCSSGQGRSSSREKMMTESHSPGRRSPQIFISYSRKDGEFVDLLAKSLQESRFAIFRDVEEILPTEDWRARLQSGIGRADTIVFVLTPESAASEVCAWESNYA